MWHTGEGWGWWMSMGWIWMVVFWGLIIYGINALLTRQDPDTPTVSSAREILARRYASGELTDEQFEAMHSRLVQARALPDPVASSTTTLSHK